MRIEQHLIARRCQRLPLHARKAPGIKTRGELKRSRARQAWWHRLVLAVMLRSSPRMQCSSARYYSREYAGMAVASHPFNGVSRRSIRRWISTSGCRMAAGPCVHLVDLSSSTTRTFARWYTRTGGLHRNQIFFLYRDSRHPTIHANIRWTVLVKALTGGIFQACINLPDHAVVVHLPSRHHQVSQGRSWRQCARGPHNMKKAAQPVQRSTHSSCMFYHALESIPTVGLLSACPGPGITAAALA